MQERAVRLAFVGTPERLAACTHDAPGGGVEPHGFVTAGAGETERLEAQLRELSPDVVVALGGGVPMTALTELPSLTLGWLTEPVDPAGCAWDGFDRLIAADSSLAADAERAGHEIWRVLGLPVADRFFRPARRPSGQVRFIDLEASVEPERLAGADVAVNRLREAGPRTDHAVLACMAAGLLLVSAALPSLRWLEPDVDFVEAHGDERVADVLRVLREQPSAFHRQRLGGRLKAERMRASSVWARVIGDLQRDVSAFGRGR